MNRDLYNALCLVRALCVCVTSSSSPALMSQWQVLRRCVKSYIWTHQSELYTVQPLYVQYILYICCVHVLHRRLTNRLTQSRLSPKRILLCTHMVQHQRACCQVIFTRMSLRLQASLAILRQTPPFPSLSATPPRPLPSPALVRHPPDPSLPQS